MLNNDKCASGFRGCSASELLQVLCTLKWISSFPVFIIKVLTEIVDIFMKLEIFNFNFSKNS